MGTSEEVQAGPHDYRRHVMCVCAPLVRPVLATPAGAGSMRFMRQLSSAWSQGPILRVSHTPQIPPCACKAVSVDANTPRVHTPEITKARSGRSRLDLSPRQEEENVYRAIGFALPSHHHDNTNRVSPCRCWHPHKPPPRIYRECSLM